MARAFVGLHRERVWERFMREGEAQHGGSKRGCEACCARTLVFMGAVCQHERRRFFDLRVLREQELQRGPEATQLGELLLRQHWSALRFEQGLSYSVNHGKRFPD